MNIKNNRETYVLNAVAHLLEFYERQPLLTFFHACNEQEENIGEAFLHLDKQLWHSLNEYGLIPNLSDITQKYAKEGGWIFQLPSEFTSQQTTIPSSTNESPKDKEGPSWQ